MRRFGNIFTPYQDQNITLLLATHRVSLKIKVTFKFLSSNIEFMTSNEDNSMLISNNENNLISKLLDSISIRNIIMPFAQQTVKVYMYE